MKMGFVILLGIFLSQAYAQSESRAPTMMGYNNLHTEVFGIYSKALEDSINFQVGLPSKTYVYTPIILTLDGEKQFNILNGVVDMLSDNQLSSYVDPAIVIGVSSVQRAEYYVYGKSIDFQKSIFTEILPLVREKYKTKGPLILVGHSNGAEFVMNAAFSDFSDAIAHILISPMIDTSTNAQMCYVGTGLAPGAQEKAERYAERTEENNLIVAAYSSQYDAQIRRNSLLLLDTIFQEKPKVKYTSMVFDRGNHITLFFEALPAGLTYIFAELKSISEDEINKIKEQKNKTDLKTYLCQIKKEKLDNYHYDFFLSLNELNALSWYFHEKEAYELEKELLSWQIEAMKKATDHQIYEGDLGFIYFLLGDIYLEENELRYALEYYEKGMPLINKTTISNKFQFQESIDEIRAMMNNKH